MMQNILFPKTPEIERFLNNIMKIQTNGPRALRTTPKIAEQLSKYKTIRNLSRYDLIDIATRKRKRDRSIIYFSEKLKINPYKGNGFIFHF